MTSEHLEKFRFTICVDLLHFFPICNSISFILIVLLFFSFFLH